MTHGDCGFRRPRKHVPSPVLDVDAETLAVLTLDWELDAVTDAVTLPLLLAVMLGDWELVPAGWCGCKTAARV